MNGDTPTPEQIEKFLKKMAKWGETLPEAERDLLAHLLESSTALSMRPRLRRADEDGFWARWVQRQY